MPGLFYYEMGFVVPGKQELSLAKPFLTAGLIPLIGGATKKKQVTDAFSQS